MGQRHQLFVIARINGKYRCLAVIHNQRIYDEGVLRQCLATIKIFQAPVNRIPLQEELKMAKSREEALWGDGAEKNGFGRVEEVHFPFIMTCLTIGASFHPADGYFGEIDVVNLYTAYNESDNNTGESWRLTSAFFTMTSRRMLNFSS